MFDLVSPDESARRRALSRHQAMVAAAAAARARLSGVWSATGWFGATEPYLIAARDQARADYRWYHDRTIFGHLEAFVRPGGTNNTTRGANAPFALLYLRWERSWPDAWRSPDSGSCSPWTTKTALLRGLGRDGVPVGIRSPLVDLVLAVTHGPYRCKDWMYGPVIRHLRDAGLADRIGVLVGADDPLIRSRARFILHVAAHPEHHVTRTSWRRWLAVDRSA